MKTETVRIDDLLNDPANVRKHGDRNLDAIKASLERFGQQKPIVVGVDGVVVAGNGTLAAARALGWETIGIVRTGLEGQERAAFAVADNRTSELAEWDDSALASLLEELKLEDDSLLDASGFTFADLEALKDFEPPEKRETKSLRDEFVVPPFSIFDARQGYWQRRKAEWIEAGIRSGDGRAENLIGYGGGASLGELDTSLFDPVLAELLVRWFTRPTDRILDPFAGGSVRGIVSAMLGRDYLGIDLRAEQVAANEVQWSSLSRAEEPRVEEVGGHLVVRHDAVSGGTKELAITRLLEGAWSEAEHLVYASPAYGFAQIAIARSCARAGRRATIFVAKRKTMHPATVAAEAAGAEIVEVAPGYLSQVQKEAREFAEAEGALLLKFGGDSEDLVETIAEIARETGVEGPPEVWCVAGSGVLTRALQRAWPNSKHVAVAIGKEPDAGAAEVLRSELKFEQESRDEVPFPSNSNYDRKAWLRFVENAPPGSLFWNVAGDPRPSEGSASWTCADAIDETERLANEGERFDFLYTCPPYGDLEVYSDDEKDLSTMDHEAFLAAYRKIIAQGVASLRDDRFAAVVVGDFREGRGPLRNFVSETIAAFEDAGAKLYNEAVLITAPATAGMRARRMFLASRKLCKTHQNVLVFYKGSWEETSGRLGDAVMFGDPFEEESDDEV